MSQHQMKRAEETSVNGKMDKKMDLVVSFDTTGSMYPVLAQVRQQVEQFVKEMFTDFKDLRLGVIAHGDYCDKDNPYTIRVMDLTRDEDELCKFIRETKQTYGGDADECYELVLNTARTIVNWREDAEKVMVMIGDASPHGVEYWGNKDRISWQEECSQFKVNGIKVFAVHALSYYRESSKMFYKTVAEKTGGTYLTLDQFNEVVDLIKATCYYEHGEEKLTEFISIIKDNGRYTNSMDRNIKRLQGINVFDELCMYKPGIPHTTKRKTVETLVQSEGLVPVKPGRFQTMLVGENCSIKKFVEDNGIKFKTGRAFYQLTKNEKVQQYKEVIAQDKSTGEMFNGSQVREKLGLAPQIEKGGITERLSSKNLTDFRVFIQSTSVNRKLIGGTTLLYEINDMDDTGTVIEVRTEGEKVVELGGRKETRKKDTKAEKDKVEKKDKTAGNKFGSHIFTPTGTNEHVLEDKKLKRLEKTSNLDKTNSDVDKYMNKVEDGLKRVNKSKNKDNLVYLSNNVKRLAQHIEKLRELKGYI